MFIYLFYCLQNEITQKREVSNDFIVVLPVVGLFEKTDPIPMSISEPVFTGSADPSLARKDNDKV